MSDKSGCTKRFNQYRILTKIVRYERFQKEGNNL